MCLPDGNCVCLYTNTILVIPVLSGGLLHPALLDEVPVYSYKDMRHKGFEKRTAEEVYHLEGLPGYVEESMCLPHSPCDIYWLTHVRNTDEIADQGEQSSKKQSSLEPTLSSKDINTQVFVESKTLAAHLKLLLTWKEEGKRKSTNTNQAPPKKKAKKTPKVCILLFS